MDIPELKIKRTEKGFEVRDEHGTVYGPVVKTQEEVEELLQSWNDYYNS